MDRSKRTLLLLAGILCSIGLTLTLSGERAQAAPRANATVQPPCDEAAFDSALSTVQGSGGGTVTFNCGNAATVLLYHVKTISSAVTVDGGGQVTMSGANLTRLFWVNAGATLTITRITITKGAGPTDGGAIYSNGTLVITNSTFEDNHAPLTNSGGAIASIGPLSIADSLFQNNSAGGGGAVYVRSSGAITSLTNATLRYNHALNTTGSGFGGAIRTSDSAPLTIQGGTVSSNSAYTSGGGIYNDTSSVLSISAGAKVESNMAIDGGGITNKGTMTLANVTLTGNQATNTLMQDGGGGLLNQGGTASLNQVTLSGNSTSGIGGGISIHNGTVSATNATISGNSAVHGGGGIGVNYGTTNLLYVTIADNTASEGNSIYTSGLALGSTKNVILASTGTGSNCYVGFSSAPLTSQGYNLSSDDKTMSQSCGFTQPTDHRGTDPQLLPLGYYGGSTYTMLPQETSPALDNGQCTTSPTVDQRGLTRPYGTACDIGAVEFQLTDTYKYVYIPLVAR